MADKKLFFTIGADITPGQKGFDQLARSASKAMSQVEDSIDDTRTAGQRFADAMESELDAVEDAMRGTKTAADALARAIGPELTAKVDTTKIVTDWQKLGLAAKDIVADIDRLADVVRRSDDLSMRGLNDDLEKVETNAKDAADALERVDDSARRTSKGTDDLSDSARGANSALANMIGNTTQDLGELGGIVGSLGVGIGQMGEYAADASLAGENLTSSLKSMAVVAGPIGALALISIGIQTIKDNLDKVAETKAFNEDRVQAFAEALSDASVTAAELAEALRVDGETGIFVRIMNETENVQESIANTLGTFDEFNKRVQQGSQGFDDYADSLRDAAKAAGLSAGEQYLLNEALEDARDGTLGYQQAFGQLDAEWLDGIRTATALGAGVSGIDTANKRAAESGKFWGRAVAESGGDAALAAQRTEDLNAQLRDYVGTAVNVPRSIVSDIKANIDQGSLNRAEQQLAILTRNRDMQVSIITRGGSAIPTQASILSGTARRAKGGPVKAGQPVWTGDKYGIDSPSAELFVPKSDGDIFTQDQLSRGTPAALGGGGGSLAINVTVNAGLGANGVTIARDFENALAATIRTNGKDSIRRLLGL